MPEIEVVVSAGPDVMTLAHQQRDVLFRSIDDVR
jgi:hypothetical protein